LQVAESPSLIDSPSEYKTRCTKNAEEPNLARGVMLPPEVKRVIIASDHDFLGPTGTRTGQEAARVAALRWRAEGRKVRIAKPTREGTDFNDIGASALL
jgi:hypothetical protein